MEKRTKFILIGLGVVAVGTGGYFLYRHLQQKGDEKDIQSFQDQINSGTNLPELPAQSKPSTPSYPKPVVYNQFPLKYKSKGSMVRDIQTALNKKYGASVPVDGDWGPKTETALNKLGLPNVITSEIYARMIFGTEKATKKPAASSGSSTPATEVDSPTISKMLHAAINSDDVFKALEALRKIYNTDKYARVSTEFKKTSIGFVTKTIVTALHDQFTSAEYRKKINNELYRIGLKYDGSKWSLSGIGGTNRLITVTSTRIWDNWGNTIHVPAATILGIWRNAGNGATKFEATDGRIFFVKTNAISYEP